MLSVISPKSSICFLNSLSDILFSLEIKFSSFNISLKYLPKYIKLILYPCSFPILVFFIFSIPNDEKGKNKTSFSEAKIDIFSISA